MTVKIPVANNIPVGMVDWTRSVSQALKELQRLAAQQANFMRNIPYQRVLTASEFRTDSSYPRVSLETEGLIQYDGVGEIRSSWTVDGIDINDATITGGIFRTEEDGPRIEIRSDLWPDGWQGIRFYDATGNSGVPEIKINNNLGMLYLTSGEQVSGSSGNSEIRLGVGGAWYLGSTHFAADTSISGSGAQVEVRTNLGKVSLVGAQGEFCTTNAALATSDGDIAISAEESAMVYGGNVDIRSNNGAITLGATNGDVNVNTATGTAWLAADNGDTVVKASGKTNVWGAQVAIATTNAGYVINNNQILISSEGKLMAWGGYQAEFKALVSTLTLSADSGSTFINASADIKLTVGTGGARSVYLINIPSISGKTANVYMDPTTGKLSRIA